VFTHFGFLATLGSIYSRAPNKSAHQSVQDFPFGYERLLDASDPVQLQENNRGPTKTWFLILIHDQKKDRRKGKGKSTYHLLFLSTVEVPSRGWK